MDPMSLSLSLSLGVSLLSPTAWAAIFGLGRNRIMASNHRPGRDANAKSGHFRHCGGSGIIG